MTILKLQLQLITGSLYLLKEKFLLRLATTQFVFWTRCVVWKYLIAEKDPYYTLLGNTVFFDILLRSDDELIEVLSDACLEVLKEVKDVK